MKYVITELKDKLSDGLVPHEVEVGDNLIKKNASYDDAREAVYSRLLPGDKVVEVYQSSGREVEFDYQRFTTEYEAIDLKYK